jgi:hypothetical protein
MLLGNGDHFENIKLFQQEILVQSFVGRLSSFKVLQMLHKNVLLSSQMNVTVWPNEYNAYVVLNFNLIRIQRKPLTSTTDSRPCLTNRIGLYKSLKKFHRPGTF